MCANKGLKISQGSKAVEPALAKPSQHPALHHSAAVITCKLVIRPIGLLVTVVRVLERRFDDLAGIRIDQSHRLAGVDD